VTGSGENTYCRNCGVRAEPGQRTCTNCGATLPTTPNTIRTDAMRAPPARGPADGPGRALLYAGLGLAMAVPALVLLRLAERAGRRS